MFYLIFLLERHAGILLIVAYFGIIHFNEEALFFVLNAGD